MCSSDLYHMDGLGGYYAKLNKSDRERQIPNDITYMWNLKKWDNCTYLQNRNRPTDIENKLMVTKGESGVEGRLGLADVSFYI